MELISERKSALTIMALSRSTLLKLTGSSVLAKTPTIAKRSPKRLKVLPADSGVLKSVSERLWPMTAVFFWKFEAKKEPACKGRV